MKHLIGVLRVGAGQQPAVAILGHVSSAESWADRPSLAVITRCLTLPLGGNPVEIKKQFLDVFPEPAQRRINDQQNGFDETRPTRRREQRGRRPKTPTPTLVLDDTCDPSAGDMLRWQRVLQVTTGRMANAPAMARLELLSDLRARMGLHAVKAEIDDKTETDLLRKAMTEVANKPPKVEEDGLALVDTSETESVALATAIFAHTAFNFIGGWGPRMPLQSGVI